MLSKLYVVFSAEGKLIQKKNMLELSWANLNKV